MAVDSYQWQLFFLAPAMARVKNIGGGPGDEDPRSPPLLPTKVKGKAKKVAMKKRKYADADTKRAAVVAATIERVERGGARSGVVIADQLSPAQRAAIEQVECHHGSPAGTVMLEGRRVALEETQPQGEPQQQIEQAREGEPVEETEQAPQLHCSSRTHTQVTPRPETQRRGSRPPPRPQGPPLVTHLDLRAATTKQVQ